MISKSMEQLVKGNSVIRALFEEGKEMAREVGAENVYDFSLGNPSVAVWYRTQEIGHYFGTYPCARRRYSKGWS